MVSECYASSIAGSAFGASGAVTNEELMASISFVLSYTIYSKFEFRNRVINITGPTTAEVIADRFEEGRTIYSDTVLSVTTHVRMTLQKVYSRWKISRVDIISIS